MNRYVVHVAIGPGDPDAWRDRQAFVLLAVAAARESDALPRHGRVTPADVRLLDDGEIVQVVFHEDADLTVEQVEDWHRYARGT